MRLAALIAIAAFPALAQHDAGLVWSSLRPGWGASNAVHNAAQGGTVVGNTRGPIQSLDGGIASNGASSAAWIGLGTNVNPLAGATEATISIWVKLSSPTLANFPIFGNDPSSGATGTVGWVIISATRQWCFWHGTRFTNYVYFDKSSLPTIHNSNWVHLATTWRSASTNVQLYINGVGMTVTPTRVGLNVERMEECNTEFRIGAFSNGLGTPAFNNGNAVRMVGVYARALSTNEIRALFMREYKDISR